MALTVEANTENKNGAILGTYEGKSADALVENNNQMKLGPKLWKNLFNSEEYKRDLARGMYIGFLGHPEDVGCQDYQHGCIVMREGKYLDDTGEVWAKFDLIDTPVGRIVKAFQDAGVTFGISVRGAGDIDANGEVNPDTFVFRGFDLVSFPAYDDAVPTFTEIAASEDVSKQVKYKSICSAINNNLNAITSASTIQVLQDTVGRNSKPYAALEHRKEEIKGSGPLRIQADVCEQKIEGMTRLYLEQVQANRDLRARLDEMEQANRKMRSENHKLERQITASKRIMGQQLSDATSAIDDSESRYKVAVAANSKLKETLESVKADSRSRYAELQSKYDALNSKYISASRDIQKLQQNNLNYQQKMSSTEIELRAKSKTISKLEQKLQETVLAASEVEKGTSNLDARVKRLESEVKASVELVEQYQEAYAELYASVLGVHLANIPVNASTSVEELKQKINSGTSTCNIAVAPQVSEAVDIIDEEDEDDIILA